MRIKRIHHLTVAVRDVDKARATFEALFDEAANEVHEVPVFGVRTSDIPIGDTALQLAAPLQPGAAVTRFIERKGEGFYNLALEVDDLNAAIAELAGRGIKVSEPVEATPGVRSSFITMSATHGLSVQLVQVLEEGAVTEAESNHSDQPSDSESAPPANGKPLLDLTPDEWSDAD